MSFYFDAITRNFFTRLNEKNFFCKLCSWFRNTIGILESVLDHNKMYYENSLQ